MVVCAMFTTPDELDQSAAPLPLVAVLRANKVFTTVPVPLVNQMPPPCVARFSKSVTLLIANAPNKRTAPP